MPSWKCRALLALILLAAAPVAHAQQTFPDRPLTMVVPFTPGAATDFLARLLSAKLEERLGKPVMVENKPGAGTNIGSNYVAKSAPDGTTLLMATSSPMAINVTLHKALPFDPAQDFVPLALVAQSPFVMVVNPKVEAKTVQEFIALAKSQPGKLSFGSGGPGSPHHLFGELFKTMTGTQMTHVSYRGSVPALNDVIAGHIEFMFCDFASAAGQIQGGKVRPLGVSTRSRIPAFPDIPPIAESGVPGYDVAAWFMVVAPSKTPPAVVEKLHGELKTILAMPDVREQISKISLLPMESQSVPAMQEFVKSEIVRWGKVVEAAGIARSE